jgi:hypothetical protein
MKKNILPVVLLMLAIVNCVSTNKLISKIDREPVLDSVSTVRVLACTQRLVTDGVFSTRPDTVHNDSCKKYEIGKIKRKFGEYGIGVACDTVGLPDSVEKSIRGDLTNLYAGDDIRTISAGDSLAGYMSKYPERYFLVYWYTGKTHSKANYFLHNVPFFLLQTLSLGFYDVYWAEGVSYAKVAILDKNTKKAIYFGATRRLGYPYEDYMINKHFEVIIDDFTKKKLRAVN